MGTLILAVMTRVSLGHTGRPLVLPDHAILIYWLNPGRQRAAPGDGVELADLAAGCLVDRPDLGRRLRRLRPDLPADPDPASRGWPTWLVVIAIRVCTPQQVEGLAKVIISPTQPIVNGEWCCLMASRGAWRIAKTVQQLSETHALEVTP